MLRTLKRQLCRWTQAQTKSTNTKTPQNAIPIAATMKRYILSKAGLFEAALGAAVGFIEGELDVSIEGDWNGVSTGPIDDELGAHTVSVAFYWDI